jgi:diguanylate cyclase (GGDEF)-like protein/PAS domain S-box-containing protein
LREVASRSGQEVALLCLIALSIAAVLWQDRLLTRSIEFSAASVPPLVSYAFNDKDVGGSSIARASSDQALGWSCRLTPQSAYPYCGMELLIDPVHYAKGVDFSRFQTVKVRIAYQGPADQLSIYLKNHDPRYSIVGRSETNKFNRLDFPIKPGIETVELALNQFGVAEWWLAANHISPEMGRPQFDNVTSMSIQTGPNAPVGQYRFRIESIRFSRALLSPEHFYLGMLGAWAILLFVLLALRVAAQKREWKLRAVASQQAEETLRRSNERAYGMLDSIPHIIWTSNLEGECTHLSPQWHEVTGAPCDADPGANWAACIHPDEREHVFAIWEASVSSGRPFDAEFRLLQRGGGFRWCLARAVAHRDGDGRITGWYGTCTDVHERILSQQALRESESLNRGILEASPDCVTLMDIDGAVLDLNEAAARSPEATPRGWLTGARTPRAQMDLGASDTALAAARAGEIGRFTLRESGATGRWWDVLVAPLRDANGAPARLVSISRDITQQKQAEERVYWVANHDALTGLPNRNLMQQRVDRAVAEAAENGSAFSLLLLDIDEFKRVNDTLGHDGGDALLCAFAERLLGAVQPGDAVFRLGGDEFAVLLAAETPGEIEAFAELLFARMRTPCIYAGRVLDLHASMGAALFPLHGVDRSDLMKNADIALYAAKTAGRGTLRVFAPAMSDAVLRRGSMLHLARTALRDDRIMPFYQPKVRLRTGAIVGFETLLRLRDRDQGVQLPGAILAAFEEAGLAAEISDRMIDRVIDDVRRWQDQGIAFGHVAINAAAAEFRREDYAESLLERLLSASIPTGSVQIEVTESVFLGRGAEYVERALKTLSRAGMKVALDDFGTGYASLSHLQQFQVDTIKIDQSFVKGLGSKGGNHAIIDAVVNLGRSLDIDVVAEGIETAEQEEALLSLQCCYGQGYLYSPAVSADAVPALLRGTLRNRSATAAA